jgi:hypothetical protein
VHEDVRARLVGKIPLHRFVRAVGITHEDLKSLLDHLSRGLLTCAGSREICLEPATKTADIGAAYAVLAGL